MYDVCTIIRGTLFDDENRRLTQGPELVHTHTHNASTPGVVESLKAPHPMTNWIQTYIPTRSSPSVHFGSSFVRTHAVTDKNLHWWVPISKELKRNLSSWLINLIHVFLERHLTLTLFTWKRWTAFRSVTLKIKFSTDELVLIHIQVL
jgi:hypothetical protein